MIEDGSAPRHPEKLHRPDNPSPRKPHWIRVKAPTSPVYGETRRIVREHGLHTVCEEAACPNIGECWARRHATMMIMGDTCTRACAFCNVKTGKPGLLDSGEPARVGDAVAKLGLAHVVVTSVDRDDLADGGAGHFAGGDPGNPRIFARHHDRSLTPDFLGKPGALEVVIEAAPDVFNHNLETVPRLYPTVRPGARYFASLQLLAQAKTMLPGLFTKSGLMVGLGEERVEIHQVMDDLRAADVDFLTIGQYLQPTPKHHAIARFVEPAEFRQFRHNGAGQGLPHGLGLAADAILLSCRCRFRRAARKPRRALGKRVGRVDADTCRSQDAALPAGPAVRSGRRYRQLPRVPALVRRLPDHQARGQRHLGRSDGGLQGLPRDLHLQGDPGAPRPDPTSPISTDRSAISTTTGSSSPARTAARPRLISTSTSSSSRAPSNWSPAPPSRRRSSAWSAPSNCARRRYMAPRTASPWRRCRRGIERALRGHGAESYLQSRQHGQDRQQVVRRMRQDRDPEVLQVLVDDGEEGEEHEEGRHRRDVEVNGGMQRAGDSRAG